MLCAIRQSEQNTSAVCPDASDGHFFQVLCQQLQFWSKYCFVLFFFNSNNSDNVFLSGLENCPGVLDAGSFKI